MQFIDLKTQYRRYKAEIDKGIQEVLDSSQYILGPQVTQIEEQLAEYCGVKHCLTVASGTDSLLIALMALGVGRGDEVITVPFTWISTAEVVALLGATPVFVDIDPDTYNIDVSKIEEAITPNTKAIMPVSIFGQMPDMEAINAIADKHNLPVIEDGAQSFGATRNGKRSCGSSTVGSTSFFPAKTLGCYGDGGALFTSDDALATKMRAIRTHGGERRHHHTCIGINGRFDTIQAAVLLAKFPHYEDELAARRKVAARYSEGLKDCCKIPVVAEGNTHVWHQYTIASPDRDTISAQLKEQGIPTAMYYPICLHQQPVFAGLGHKKGDFPVAETVADQVLSFPIHPWLEEEDQQRIIAAVRKVAVAAV